MTLPDLHNDYSHSVIQDVKFGPRNEVTISVCPLDWNGQSGRLAPPKSLRFGGIVNLDEAKAFFNRKSNLELAYLRYSAHHRSKPGNLFVELHSERTGDALLIRCSSIELH